MFTKDDKNWLIDNFVTRGEYRSDISELKVDIKDMKESVDKILNAIDKFSGRIADLDQENKMGAVTL